MIQKSAIENIYFVILDLAIPISFSRYKFDKFISQRQRQEKQKRTKRAQKQNSSHSNFKKIVLIIWTCQKRFLRVIINFGKIETTKHITTSKILRKVPKSQAKQD